MTAYRRDDDDYSCLDCKEDVIIKGDMYMVTDSVWALTGLSTDWLGGLLCVACLENRLARALKPTDFTRAPINDYHLPTKSELLKKRLRGD